MRAQAKAILVLLAAWAVGAPAWAGKPLDYRVVARRHAALHPRIGSVAEKVVRDPTRYDCRNIVSYERVRVAGSKYIHRRAIRECPHQDKLMAGQCETHWLFGMRCKS